MQEKWSDENQNKKTERAVHTGVAGFLNGLTSLLIKNREILNESKTSDNFNNQEKVTKFVIQKKDIVNGSNLNTSHNFTSHII
jgi:hypothetical protein